MATYLLSTSPYEVWFVNPRVTRDPRPAGVPRRWPSCPGCPTWSTSSAGRDDLPGVLDETIAVGARTFWLQLGLRRRRRWPAAGEDAGLEVVMDRCLKIEHARFHGGLHLAGFDTGVISSRRRPLRR